LSFDTDDTDEEIDIHNFTIRQTGLPIALGVILTVIFLPIFIYTFSTMDYENPNNLPALLVVLPLVLFGPFLIIIRVRWKLKINDNQITFTPHIGRTKSFTFDQITRVKQITRQGQYGGEMRYYKAYHYDEELFTVSSLFHELIILLALFVKNGVKIEE